MPRQVSYIMFNGNVDLRQVALSLSSFHDLVDTLSVDPYRRMVSSHRWFLSFSSLRRVYQYRLLSYLLCDALIECGMVSFDVAMFLISGAHRKRNE